MTTTQHPAPQVDPATHALNLLSKALYVRVNAITQTGDDDDTAQIRLYITLPADRGTDTIRIGTVANLWNFGVVRRKIATRTGIIPDQLKPAEWMDILTAVYTHAMSREDDAELSTVGRLAAILPTYILEVGSRHRDEACAAGNPYIDDDEQRVYIHAETLALWLGRAKGWRIDAPDVRHALRDLAWEPSVALNYSTLDEATGGKTRRKARYHGAPATDWLDTDPATT